MDGVNGKKRKLEEEVSLSQTQSSRFGFEQLPFQLPSFTNEHCYVELTTQCVVFRASRKTKTPANDASLETWLQLQQPNERTRCCAKEPFPLHLLISGLNIGQTCRNSSDCW